MLKYFDEKDKYVVDEPSLWTVNGSVDIQYAGGTEHKSGNFTIQVGNIESYNPTELEAEKEPEVTPTPTPSGGGDEPSGGGDTPSDGSDTPGGDTPVTPDPTPTPSGNGITFKITNTCGKEIRLSGKVKINASRTPTNWNDYIELDANFHGPQSGSSWNQNDIIIPNNTSKELTIANVTYAMSYNSANPLGYTDSSLSGNLANGTWYFMNMDNPNNQYKHPINLYSRIWKNLKNESEGSNDMYRINNYPQNTLITAGQTYNLEINWMNPKAELAPSTSKEYSILEYGKTTL